MINQVTQNRKPLANLGWAESNQG